MRAVVRIILCLLILSLLAVLALEQGSILRYGANRYLQPLGYEVQEIGGISLLSRSVSGLQICKMEGAGSSPICVKAKQLKYEGSWSELVRGEALPITLYEIRSLLPNLPFSGGSAESLTLEIAELRLDSFSEISVPKAKICAARLILLQVEYEELCGSLETIELQAAPFSVEADVTLSQYELSGRLSSTKLESSDKLRIDYEFSGDASVIAPYLPDDTAVIQSGAVRAKGSFRFDNFELEGRIEFSKLKAETPWFSFESGSFTAGGRVLGGKVNAETISGSIDRIDLGIPFQELTFLGALTYDMEKQSAVGKIRSVKADTLGGRIRSEPFNLRTDQSSFQVPLRLEAIELDRLSPYITFSGVSLTGSVSGSIPVKVSKKGLSIDNGKLKAGRPGDIRYRPVNEPQNEQLRYASEIFRDFRYEELSGALSLDEKGESSLQLRINGRSRSSKIERPVVLNFNLEQNLYELWKSIQISRDVERRMDELF